MKTFKPGDLVEVIADTADRDRWTAAVYIGVARRIDGSIFRAWHVVMTADIPSPHASQSIPVPSKRIRARQP